MKPCLRKLLKLSVLILSVVLITVLAVRAYDVHGGPSLQLWHTHVPHEMSRKEIAQADWTAYIAAENAVFDEVKREVTDKLEADVRVPGNRYYQDSSIYPGHFKQDWNRSFLLEPQGGPRGAVVLLHGLTDAPYSLRHIAALYQQRGYVVVAIRMPGHGTVPAGLTDVEWEDWLAATHLAVKEARRRVPAPLPLQLVGYSNGGALALKYTLEALDDTKLPRPDRLVLIAPMIGVTELARFAGVFGWPKIFPAFAKAAWLDIVPEFNPFKYNSFPVNAASQSSLLTRNLQAHIVREEGRLQQLPPILTFQSIVDYTVSTRSVVNSLYARLPDNGSELVLFDLNRYIKFGPLLRSGNHLQADRLLPPAPRNFRSTVITNAGSDTRDVKELSTAAQSNSEQRRALGLAFPADVFSLSHLALPFPLSDPLYGTQPDNSDDFGVNLGAMAIRGERGALIVSQDALTRLMSNPFFPYMMERIDEGLSLPDKR
jgi:alpha-beta hydrolase superfamily lysophospholipase